MIAQAGSFRQIVRQNPHESSESARPRDARESKIPTIMTNPRTNRPTHDRGIMIGGGGGGRLGCGGMTVVRLVLLYIHLIGFALLLGGAAVQYFSGVIRINSAMVWGAGIQVLSGLGLAAPLRGGGDAEPDPVKLAVKAVVGILIFVMVFFSRKREVVNSGHFLAIVGLTLANAAVAVFWR